MRCRDLELQLASVDEPLRGRAARHVEHCLRCQAEQAHYRSLVRALGTLQQEELTAPVGLLEDVIHHVQDGMDAELAYDRLVRRLAVAGGLVAAAGAVAGVVLARRGALAALGRRLPFRPAPASA